MRHAGAEALTRLGPLIARLREREALREKKPGVFYLKSRAFLHFHEDPKGLFADVRLGADFSRHPVSTGIQQERLIATVDRFLAAD